jgi:metallophosphoesterase superfamily enzyme
LLPLRAAHGDRARRQLYDGKGPARVAASDRTTLAALQRGRDWIWIKGNHDPDPPMI